VTVCTAVLASQALADANLIGDYRFQDSRASSGGTLADVTDLGAGNAFATETVGDCRSRVLTFPRGNGLQLSTAAGMDLTYSVQMLVRLSDVSGFRKLLDPSNGTAERGFYVHEGVLDWFGSDNANHQGPSAALANNTYANIVLTFVRTDLAKERLIGSVNGVEQFSYLHDPANQIDGMPVAQILRFFQDEAGNQDEDSAGAVSQIRVFDGGLTAPQIAQYATTVHPPACFPVAVDDPITVARNAGLTPIDVLANDADLDGGPKSITSNTSAANGAVAITNGGADLVYAPATDYCGPDSFQYTLNGGSTATVSVTVTCPVPPDITPPETTITSGPKAKTTSKSATFEFASNETGSTFECSLDGAPFVACTSPDSVKAKKSGSHNFQVRARDAAGNVDKTEATYLWKLKHKRKHHHRR
jgi:hypothetical protein